MAARVDVDQAYISRLEAGQKNPTVSTLQQVAAALDVEVKDLFDSKK